MKITKLTLLLLLALSAAFTSEAVLARGHVGVFIGGPLFWPGPYYGSPYYYPPYYPGYYPPAVVVPAAPATYVEQGAPQAGPAPRNNWWYYCADSRTYYPYAKECPAGWQRVAPQPGS